MAGNMTSALDGAGIPHHEHPSVGGVEVSFNGADVGGEDVEWTMVDNGDGTVLMTLYKVTFDEMVGIIKKRWESNLDTQATDLV